jgi:BSD domain
VSDSVILLTLHCTGPSVTSTLHWIINDFLTACVLGGALGGFEQKGMLSVMLMDMEGTKNADGSRRIDLTKEKRDQIFLMYPAVRKAFEAEVPLNKTETDFWVAYFQSEYFARDKGGRATAGDEDSYGRTDDIFSRYEERLGDSLERRAAAPSSSSQNKSFKKNLAGLVGSDVDLTAVLGDFGPTDASNLGETLLYFDFL